MSFISEPLRLSRLIDLSLIRTCHITVLESDTLWTIRSTVREKSTLCPSDLERRLLVLWDRSESFTTYLRWDLGPGPDHEVKSMTILSAYTIGSSTVSNRLCRWALSNDASRTVWMVTRGLSILDRAASSLPCGAVLTRQELNDSNRRRRYFSWNLVYASTNCRGTQNTWLATLSWKMTERIRSVH